MYKQRKTSHEMSYRDEKSRRVMLLVHYDLLMVTGNIAQRLLPLENINIGIQQVFVLIKNWIETIVFQK
ncbi:hypothetical protein DID88_007437 [Monilinia fructigena]|uniref:Uncharacterized protein n=1 Tax=Monilinia fructigena TaxID=38457 RepID=A0A395JDC5_9HELO|nr:hypothetical protein DID88_007437 [Monilinia fructigena]